MRLYTYGRQLRRPTTKWSRHMIDSLATLNAPKVNTTNRSWFFVKADCGKRLALVCVTSAYESTSWKVMRSVRSPSGDVAFWQEVRSFLYRGSAVRTFNRMAGHIK